MKRVILIVMDSLGVGAAPDADKYGDAGTNTFVHAAENTEGFSIPALSELGMGNINGANGKYAVSPETLLGSFGKMREYSKGKDTITGHWEIAGIETTTPFKTYPNGFPKEFIQKFQEAIGTEVLGNYPESGTVIIDRLGEEHEATGKPIVYTSADSVFQIAANTEVIPLERLYEICRTAREMLVGDWACGRVIARPYIIDDSGKRVRTSDRHDYAVNPPEPTVLDHISEAGQTVYAVGKIKDIFAGQGITESVHTEDNMDGVDRTLDAMKEDFGGLIFTNLVDFDSLFGHRRDPSGYGKAIMELDRRIPEIKEAMRDEDILILTADHGNDPIHTGFDHTREFVPILVCGARVRPGVDLGIRATFADCGQTIADYLGVEKTAMGESFLKDILK